MPTETYTIAASHDDAGYDNGLDACYNETTYIDVTSYTEGYPQYGGLRFLNVALGNGTKVISAYLRFMAAADATGSTIRVRGVLQVNPVAWEVPNCNPDDRPVTTAYADWATGAVVQGQWYQTADISAPLQEVLDQARPSGNPVAFMLSSTGGPDIWFCSDHLGDHSSAPQLVVTWQPKVAGHLL